MPKKVFFDFLHVTMPEAEDFSSLLDTVRAIPLEKRSQKVRGEPVRLQTCDKHRDRYYGSLVRLRSGLLPGKTHFRGGDIEDIPLEDDESICELTGFLYVPERNTLVLQRCREGVTRLKAMEYFGRIGDLGPIHLLPILHPDSLKRLKQMKHVKEYLISIAGVTNRALFAEEGYKIGTVTDLMKEFRAPTINIKLSMSRQKGGTLNIGKVLESADKLVRLEETKALRVSGRRSPDAEVDVVDILTDKIEYAENIPFEKRERIGYDMIRAALVHAWDRREGLISKSIKRVRKSRR